MTHTSYPIAMEIAGNTAMWTRPDTGDCPVSYPAPTYSAVKGIFEAVLWGPDIEIIPTKVELCTPIEYHVYCTNYGGPLRDPKNIRQGNNYQLLATVLIDVCYKLYARVTLNPDKAGLPEAARRWDANTTSPGHAYQSIFQRRLKRGQCFSVPVLGWREFTPSYFGPLRSQTHVLSDMPPVILPSMLRQVFSEGIDSPVSYRYDQNLSIVGGVLRYPERGDEHAQ